jgi:putative endonuclease
MTSCDIPLTQWFVYLVENKFGHWYCGVTTDVERRFAEHQADGKLTAKALKGKGPLRLQHVVTCTNKRTAMQIEYWVKQLSKAQKIAWVAQRKECPFPCSQYSLK